MQIEILGPRLRGDERILVLQLAGPIYPGMMRVCSFAIAAAMTAFVAAGLLSTPAPAQPSPSYGPPIALPEPWLANRQRSIASPQRPNVTKRTVRRLRGAEARRVYPLPDRRVVPSFIPGQAGPVTFPPLEPPRAAVPGAPPRLDTFNDRVSRCVHYGTATGVSGSDMAVYTHSCASQ